MRFFVRKKQDFCNEMRFFRIYRWKHGGRMRNDHQRPAGEAPEECSDALADEHSSPTLGIRRPDAELK